MVSSTLNEFAFDIDKAKDCVTTYSQSTGVECILINNKGETLFKKTQNLKCDFCQKLSSICNIEQYCQKSHLYGAYQAERFGGTYIFFCPIGLVHWASPIMVDGTLKGALLGGHILMVQPDSLLLEEVIRKFNIPSDKMPDLKSFFNEIQIVSPERVKHLSDLLFIISNHISDDHYLKFLEQRKNLDIKSDISHYIKYLKTMGGDNVDQQCYPIEKEKQLLSLIALGDKNGSQKILNEILSYIFILYGMNFDQLKARILELIVLLSRAALEGGADIEQIFGLNYDYLSYINKCKTVDELLEWISKILLRFIDCVFNLGDAKHFDAIYKAIDYIKRNYMNKVTLEEVASHVNFSTPYFCKIFKEEMNCNFNIYLKKVRIEKSKNLLLDHSLTIVDIANMVGFHDQSHFSRIFKSMVGVSPGKYRDSKGVITNNI